jgi:REP element-mobilizing transposase RayT
MSRPLRIDVAGGWYHVTARGIERRKIYRDDRDKEHFLEVLEDMVDRFGIAVHAYVLMENHYHLIVECPDANLSRAIQWLNVSYVVWFNRRHNRVGPLMQGRFKNVLVENSAWAYALSVYVHLNPVMRKDRGLGKREKKAESLGFVVPTEEEARVRTKELRNFQWSSYQTYMGVVPSPAWLTTKEILRRAHCDPQKQVAHYRDDVENRLTKGVVRSEEQPAAPFAVGTPAFLDKTRKMAKTGREIVEPQGLRKRVSWETLVHCVETITGEKFATAMKRRGSVGRLLLLWTARRYGRMSLKEVGRVMGGMDYTAVAMATKRFEAKAQKDPHLQEVMEKVREQCEV